MKLIYLQHTEGININFSEKPTTPKQVFSSKRQVAADTVNHVLSFLNITIGHECVCISTVAAIMMYML